MWNRERNLGGPPPSPGSEPRPTAAEAELCVVLRGEELLERAHEVAARVDGRVRGVLGWDAPPSPDGRTLLAALFRVVSAAVPRGRCVRGLTLPQAEELLDQAERSGQPPAEVALHEDGFAVRFLADANRSPGRRPPA